MRLISPVPLPEIENHTTYVRYDFNISELEAIEIQRNLSSRDVTLEFIATAVSYIALENDLLVLAFCI